MIEEYNDCDIMYYYYLISGDNKVIDYYIKHNCSDKIFSLIYHYVHFDDYKKKITNDYIKKILDYIYDLDYEDIYNFISSYHKYFDLNRHISKLLDCNDSYVIYDYLIHVDISDIRFIKKLVSLKDYNLISELFFHLLNRIDNEKYKKSFEKLLDIIYSDTNIDYLVEIIDLIPLDYKHYISKFVNKFFNELDDDSLYDYITSSIVLSIINNEYDCDYLYLLRLYLPPHLLKNYFNNLLHKGDNGIYKLISIIETFNLYKDDNKIHDDYKFIIDYKALIRNEIISKKYVLSAFAYLCNIDYDDTDIFNILYKYDKDGYYLSVYYYNFISEEEGKEIKDHIISLINNKIL